MKMLATVFWELSGLFIDDGSLAFAILALVVLSGLLTYLTPEFPLVAGAVLLFGCLAVLLANVVRAAGR